MNEADKLTTESLKTLQALFAGLHLSAGEREFVNSASAKIARFAYDLFTQLPIEEYKHMRPIVIAVAIANIMGPPPGDLGVDILKVD